MVHLTGRAGKFVYNNTCIVALWNFAKAKRVGFTSRLCAHTNPKLRASSSRPVSKIKRNGHGKYRPLVCTQEYVVFGCSAVAVQV